MSFPHHKNLLSRSGSRSGFTLVELLVVIGIIAILAGVALGPITSGIKTAQHNTGMQSSRQIAILCFQYSVDNDGAYPAATTAGGATTAAKSEGVAQQLLAAKYTSDPTIFFLAAPGKAKFTGTDYTTFAANNISWNFMTVGGTSGLTSAASDLLPVIWCAGNAAVTPPVAPVATGTPLTLTAAANPYGADGIAVTYKSNSAQFLKARIVGANSVVNSFIPASYNDATVYNEIAP